MTQTRLKHEIEARKRLEKVIYDMKEAQKRREPVTEAAGGKELDNDDADVAGRLQTGRVPLADTTEEQQSHFQRLETTQDDDIKDLRRLYEQALRSLDIERSARLAVEKASASWLGGGNLKVRVTSIRQSSLSVPFLDAASCLATPCQVRSNSESSPNMCFTSPLWPQDLFHDACTTVREQDCGDGVRSRQTECHKYSRESLDSVL